MNDEKCITIKKSCKFEMFFLGLCLAFGLAVGGYFIGQTMYNAKVALNATDVKGLAVRRVEADLANWTIKFNVATADRDQISLLYKELEEQQKTIINLLKENGLGNDEIQIGVVDHNYYEYRDENQKVVDQRHQLTGSLNIETKNVRLISKVRVAVNKLIAQGINVENRAPRYLFTKLNEIKPDMLREAAKNARIAANEFAQNADANVGGIRSARQGSFTVRDVGETYDDTTKIDKEVRVVTNITFYLID